MIIRLVFLCFLWLYQLAMYSNIYIYNIEIFPFNLIFPIKAVKIIPSYSR